MLSAGVLAREIITKVTSVPLPINPISQTPVVELYVVPLGRIQSTNSNSDGNKSFKLTLVALVPLPALDTVTVQIAISSTKYSSLSLVILTDTSVNAIGSTVQSTISVAP